MRRFVASLLPILLLVGCERRDPYVRDKESPPAVAQQESILASEGVTLRKGEVYGHDVVRCVTWPASAPPGDEELTREAGVFITLVRFGLGTRPLWVVEHMQPGFEDRLLGGASYAHRRPIETYSDGDLAKLAGMWRGDVMIRSTLNREEGTRRRLSLSVHSVPEGKALYRREFLGEWEEIGQQIGTEAPQILGAMGVDDSLVSAVHPPLITSQAHFFEAAKASHSPEEFATVLRAWDAAAPSPTIFSLLYNIKPQDEEIFRKAVERVNTVTPLDGPLAAYMVWRLKTSADRRQAFDVLHHTYPKVQHPIMLIAQDHLGDNKLESALRLVNEAEKLAPGAWNIHSHRGYLYHQIALKTQAGRTMNYLSVEERQTHQHTLNQALKELDQALTINPLDAFSVRTRAEVMNALGIGKTHDLIRELERAIELDAESSERAIVTMLWICAPGYRNEPELARRLVEKHRDKVRSPQVIRTMLTPLRQCYQQAMSLNQDENMDWGEDPNNEADVRFLGEMLMKALEGYEGGSKRFEQEVFAYTQFLRVTRYGFDNPQPLADAVEKLHIDHAFQHQYMLVSSAFILMKSLRYREAIRFFDRAVDGPDPKGAAQAKLGRLYCLAMLGPVSAVDDAAAALREQDLHGLGKGLDLYPIYARVLHGTPEEQREAARTLEEMNTAEKGTRHSWQLELYYLSSGQAARARETFIARMGPKPALSREDMIRWKQICEALGQEAIWSPADQ